MKLSSLEEKHFTENKNKKACTQDFFLEALFLECYWNGTYFWGEGRKQDKGTEGACWGSEGWRGSPGLWEQQRMLMVLGSCEIWWGIQEVEMTLVLLAWLSTVLIPGQQVLRLRSCCPASPSLHPTNLGLDRFPLAGVCFASISKLLTTCTSNFLMHLVFSTNGLTWKDLSFSMNHLNLLLYESAFGKLA